MRSNFKYSLENVPKYSYWFGDISMDKRKILTDISDFYS